MPSIGARCHELRIPDDKVTWRIIYRIDDDAIVILDVFRKKNSKRRKLLSIPVNDVFAPMMPFKCNGDL